MKNVFRTLKLFARGEVHLHLALTTLFVLLLLASSITAMAYTYVQTTKAAVESAWQVMTATNHGMYRDVLRYLGTAKRSTTAVGWALRDVTAVHEYDKQLLPIIAGQLRAQREVFAMSVGDASGSLLMVGKIFEDPKYSVNKAKHLPPEVKYRIHRVDRLSEPKTETYEYLNEDMKVIDQETVPTENIQYDCRTKPWFQEAREHKANAWTDVILFKSGQFGASNVEPIVGSDGNLQVAVSATIALSLQDGITSRLKVGDHGMAFVVDHEGKLIIHPDRSKITRCDKPGNCRFNRITEIGDPALAAAYERYLEKSNLGKPENTPTSLDFRVYSSTIGRLKPEARAAFDRLYRLDDKAQTIVLRENLTKQSLESLSRVLTSIAYRYDVRFRSGGKEYLASFQGFPERYGKPWTVGTLVPIDDFIGGLKRTLVHVALISAALLLLAIFIIVVAARRILRPLALISQDMNRIQTLDIDESLKHSSFFYEIDTIGTALGSMKHGLSAFSKFVPVTLVKQLIASGTGARLGGEKRRLTMMFTDIEGFTTLSESMPTEALLAHISEYLDNLTPIILQQQGTVDKYIGDAIMSFWGAPLPDLEHELHGCRAALLCVNRLKELNQRWSREGKPELHTRFGLSTGDVSVGNMGSSERMSYTVLGDAVNLASRLEGINKYYGTRIIVGEATYQSVKNLFMFRPVDVVAVKGKKQGVRIYELIAGPQEDSRLAPTKEDLRRKELTERAFEAYLNRDFELARTLYEQLAQTPSDEILGRLFVERCSAYLATPPDPDWTGVTHMAAK